MTKIYLDNCCLNRPFDDQTQPRILMEAEAVKTILKLYEQGYWEIVISQVSLVEVRNVKDPSKRQKLQYIVSQIRSLLPLSEPLIQRAKYFESNRLEAMDAMHLACAEQGAEVFLTVVCVGWATGLSLPTFEPDDWCEMATVLFVGGGGGV